MAPLCDAPAIENRVVYLAVEETMTSSGGDLDHRMDDGNGKDFFPPLLERFSGKHFVVAMQMNDQNAQCVNV